jgi:hypothetical protein
MTINEFVKLSGKEAYEHGREQLRTGKWDYSRFAEAMRLWRQQNEDREKLFCAARIAAICGS